MKEIPELTTLETRAIRASYPCPEHLEAGNSGAWLQERRDQLLARARNGRSEMNLAKLLTLGTAAVGAVCYATSPLAPIGALIAGIGYAWTVAQDMNESHQFCPLPFIRGDFIEFLSAMGDRESREQYLAGADPLVELMFHLEPMERFEFGMLQSHIHTLADYLAQVESGKKFYAYRWLLSWFINLRGGFPNKEALVNHVATIGGDPKINAPQVAAIKEFQAQATDYLINGLPSTQVSPLPSAAVANLPAASSASEQSPAQKPEPPRVIIVPPAQPPDEAPSPQEPEKVIDVPAIPSPPAPPAKTASVPTKKAAEPGAPTPQQLLKLPLKERAIAVIEALAAGEFDVSRCTDNQIVCVAGNQRGGKGTLIGILSILASALDSNTQIVYFTAGDDIYPFRCHQLICRLNYPDLDGSHADKRVAVELLQFLKRLDNAKVGECSNLILVIDEAVALSDYLQQEQKQWMIRFLLTRLSKKGLQLFLALHAQNLTSWVGSGNAGGFSSTFKSGAKFIGCEATTKKISALKSISLATGRYFVAFPDEFNRSIEGGEIGTIPPWLKTETNPSTGQPDPVRSLLKFFPELSTEYVSPQVEEPESTTQPELVAQEIEADEAACNSFEELLEAICNSFREKGAVRIKRIPSGCNRVRTALKQFDEQKHEGILVLLIERLVKEGRVKLPNSPELEVKVRTGRGSLNLTDEFEVV